MEYSDSSSEEWRSFFKENTRNNLTNNLTKSERQKTQLSLKRDALKKLQFYCQQQEAKEWIEAILKIKLESESLQESLSDGVILCQLMQKIQPSLRMPSIKPASNPYKQMQNVQLFIQECAKYEVKSLFLADDLVNGSDMESVIHCLHSLARQAEKNGFEPKLVRTPGLIEIFKKPGEQLLETLAKEYPSAFVASGKGSLKKTFSLPELPAPMQKPSNRDPFNQDNYQRPSQQINNSYFKKAYSVIGMQKFLETDSKPNQSTVNNTFPPIQKIPSHQQTNQTLPQTSSKGLKQEHGIVQSVEQKIFSSQRSASQDEKEPTKEEEIKKEEKKEEKQEKQEEKENGKEEDNEEEKGEHNELQEEIFSITFGGKTDPGTRYNGMNQDYFIAKEFQNSHNELDTFYLFGVFDGHGQLGEFASKIGGDYFLKFFESEASKCWNKKIPFLITKELIDKCFLEAHQAIIDYYSLVPKEYTYIGRDYEDTLFYLREENGNFFYVNSKMEEDTRIVDFGTTAVVAIIQGTKLFIANAGDSEAIIGKISYGSLLPVTLTTVHNCENEDEVDRIQTDFPNTEFSERGYIIVRPQGSVEYHLAMTKALGHKQLFEYGIIPNPTINEEELTDRHLFLILASDGIWDAMDPEAVAEFVDEEPQINTAQELVNSLVDKALELGNEDDKDNATAIVVMFKPHKSKNSDEEESEKEKSDDEESEKEKSDDEESEKEKSNDEESEKEKSDDEESEKEKSNDEESD